MDGVLLAAGRGKRMWPVCTRTPKPLVEVMGRSLLHTALDAMAAVGVGRIFVVASKANARELVGACKRWKGPVPVRVLVQSVPKGTGHALAVAAKAVRGDACLVAMGDSLLDPDALRGLVAAKGFAVATCKVDDVSRFGALTVRGRKVVAVAEKPAKAGPGIANTGMYRVPREDLAACARLKLSARGELEFTDVLGAAARAGRLTAVRAQGWLDVGRPWDLLALLEQDASSRLAGLLARRRQGGPGTIEEGVQVKGRVFVGAGSVVRSGVYIEGDVHIGAGARVGPNAYLRGPLSIGDGCIVGAHCEVKASVLLAKARVPHLSYVGDSVLGEDCNLGAGTITANFRHDAAEVTVEHEGRRISTGRTKFGAVVGDGTKTGIGTRLLPGTVLGPGVWTQAGEVVKGTRQATKKQGA